MRYYFYLETDCCFSVCKGKNTPELLTYLDITELPLLVNNLLAIILLSSHSILRFADIFVFVSLVCFSFLGIIFYLIRLLFAGISFDFKANASYRDIALCLFMELMVL